MDKSTPRRTILVTGASKGIGRATAIRLARDGFAVCVHYHQDTRGAEATLETIRGIQGEGRLLCFDLTSRKQCAEVLAKDLAEYSAYYGIVLNAGIARDGAFPMLSGEDWDSVLETNLGGFRNVLHPCLPAMIASRQGGRIITLSSISGLVGNRGQVNYSASKAGIIGATKALAVELARRAITVNCVAPGLIETGMQTMHEEALTETMKQIPMQRIGKPEEVAAVIAFLASEDAAYITRQVISVNGGLV